MHAQQKRGRYFFLLFSVWDDEGVNQSQSISENIFLFWRTYSLRALTVFFCFSRGTLLLTICPCLCGHANRLRPRWVGIEIKKAREERRKGNKQQRKKYMIHLDWTIATSHITLRNSRPLFLSARKMSLAVLLPHQRQRWILFTRCCLHTYILVYEKVEEWQR